MGERSADKKFKQLHDQKRSGPQNGPDSIEETKQEEMASWDEGKTRLQEARGKRGIFDVSSFSAVYSQILMIRRNPTRCRNSNTLGNLKL